MKFFTALVLTIMNTKLHPSIFNKHSARTLVAVLIGALLIFSDLAVFARSGRDARATVAPAQGTQDAPRIPNEQLDSLVAPIALYPDPLLSQVLVASTYPLEIIQLQQWLNGKGQSLDQTARVAAVKEQDWDASIQAMVLLPETVKQLAANITWTQDLGNAFLAQQGDVMAAVQRMRAKAKDAGKLTSNEQMKVETEEIESQTFVVIEQSDPEMIYVPSYDPVDIWGTVGYYPYPPIYYPPYGGRIAFGIGIAIGIAWGGGWGWGAGWGNNDININRNNNFVSHYNRNNINRGNRVNPLGSGNNTWQHNPQHRGGAPYRNKDVANRFNGAGRGDSISNRQANPRQNIGSMGGDRIGSRDTSRNPTPRNNGSFGNNGSWKGSAARSSSSRGSSSIRSGGWGGRGGGGMRGGGMRGGGRRR